jgi:hypothetical protein
VLQVLDYADAASYHQKYQPVKAALRCLVLRIIVRAQEHFEASPVICSQLYLDVNLLKQAQVLVNIGIYGDCSSKNFSHSFSWKFVASIVFKFSCRMRLANDIVLTAGYVEAFASNVA